MSVAQPIIVAVMLLTGAGLVRAADVTVSVTTRGGDSAENAVVVFDPLDAHPAPAHGTATIDQIHKQYVPRVTVLRTGTSVTFPNSDHIRHEVYSLSPAKTFNLKLYAASPPTDVLFDKPGLVVLGCNIHDSMVAFVLVVDSPYFAKVPATGTVVVKLPPGRYRLRVWHEKLATAVVTREVTVADAPTALPVTIDLDPNRDTVAAWPQA